MAELLARISSRELTEWAAYEQMTGPLDLAARGDYQAAQITAAVVNVQRGKKAPIPGAKFLQRWDPEPERSPEDLFALAMQANTALGGSFTKG